MNKIFKIFSVIIAVLLLASCNDGKTPAETTATTVTTESVTTAVTTTVTDVTEVIAETMTETQTEETTVTETNVSAEVQDPVIVGQNEPVVLMYHLIMEEPFNSAEGLFVRPSDFAAQLDEIVASGADTLFADEYRLTVDPSVIITFDDGYEDNYTTAYPMLKERGLKATIFLITDLIDTEGYLTRGQIREMAESGLIRFGCHTKSHLNLAEQPQEIIRRQLDISKLLIKDLVGYEPRALAYPTGGYNDLAVRMAAERFDFAYTTKDPRWSSSANPMTLPRYTVYRDSGKGFVSSCIG